MQAIENNVFISPPAWLKPTEAPAATAGPPPVLVDLSPLLPRFAAWEELSPGQRAKLLRDSGLLAGRAAGLSVGKLAPAAGLVKSRVAEILGGLAHAQ